MFILDDVRCTGSENSLFECPHNKKENCGPSEGAGAVCVTVELRGGPNDFEGNLFINNKPVCDDDWDLTDADVACKMLLG